ncbi:hypothetical protein QR685DRAFT_541939 [Neurospora intermedia]|uniref:Uncharacterized protein n=1 Tax=Neurospora intermedia TaxID=5142 RepID=A0ABR3DKU8_NEUIN
MDDDYREVDRPNHLVAERGDWMLTTLLHPTGERYDPENWLKNRPSAAFFVVGYSMYTGRPVVMVGDLENVVKPKSKIPRFAASPAFSGRGVGAMYKEIGGGRYPGGLVPVVSLFRQGLFPALKLLVNNLNPVTAKSPIGLSQSDQEALAANQEAIIQAISVGAPAPIPDRFARGPRYHHSSVAVSGTEFFRMPLFRIKLDQIPREVFGILSHFINANPLHLLYPITLIQATLKFLFIVSDTSRRTENRATDTKPVPLVSLEQFLIYYSHFESFHQIFKLAFYIHPFRWISAQIERNSTLVATEGEPHPLNVPEFPSTERLLDLLTPFSTTPIAFMLPYAYPGSTLPDLQIPGYLSPAHTQELANACLFHWLILGPPSQPLWRDMANKNKRKKRQAEPFDQTRDVIIPYKWIQPLFRDSMDWEATSLPESEDRIWDLNRAVSLFAGHTLEGPLAGPQCIDFDEGGLEELSLPLDEWEDDEREPLAVDRAHPVSVPVDAHLPALSADVLALPPSQFLAPVHCTYLKHHFQNMFREADAVGAMPPNLRLSSFGIPYLTLHEPSEDDAVVSPDTMLDPIPPLGKDENPTTIQWEINSLSTEDGFLPAYFRLFANMLGRKKDNQIVKPEDMSALVWSTYCQYVDDTFPLRVYISILESLASQKLDPKKLLGWWTGRASAGIVTFAVLRQSCLDILDSEDPEKILLVEGMITALNMFPSAALKQLKAFDKKFIPPFPDHMHDYITDLTGREDKHDD